MQKKNGKPLNGGATNLQRSSKSRRSKFPKRPKLSREERDAWRDKVNKLHVDILLKNIIEAYPHPDGKSAEQRIAIVRGALFGDKQKAGRKELSDHHAMFAILNEIYKEDIDLLKTWLAGVNPEYSTTDAKAEIEREPLALKTAARKFQDLADLQGSQAPSDENLEVRLSRKVKKIQKEVAAGRFTSNDMAVLEGGISWELSKNGNRQ